MPNEILGAWGLSSGEIWKEVNGIGEKGSCGGRVRGGGVEAVKVRHDSGGLWQGTRGGVTNESDAICSPRLSPEESGQREKEGTT